MNADVPADRDMTLVWAVKTRWRTFLECSCLLAIAILLWLTIIGMVLTTVVLLVGRGNQTTP